MGLVLFLTLTSLIALVGPMLVVEVVVPAMNSRYMLQHLADLEAGGRVLGGATGTAPGPKREVAGEMMPLMQGGGQEAKVEWGQTAM